MSSIKVNEIGPIDPNAEFKINGKIVANDISVIQSVTDITPVGNNVVNNNSLKYLSYGINVITTADESNYVVRLPQTPTKGRTLSVINNSSVDIVVYPSTNGSTIDGQVHGGFIVPSNGGIYNFTCYNTQSVARWSAPIVQLPGRRDSGEIIADNFLGYTGWISASDPLRWVNSSSIAGNTGWSFDSLNNPYYFIQPQIGLSGAAVAFKPRFPWNFITKITVYTNMTQNYGQLFGLSSGRSYNYYLPGTTTWFSDAGPTNAGNLGTPPYGYVAGTLAGTPITIPGTSGFTANAGDPGTVYLELVYSACCRPDRIGDNFLQTAIFTLNDPNTGTPVTQLYDQYFSTYLNFAFCPRINATGIKFRHIIEYI